MRDALSLLDQCGAAGGRIDGERVLDVLGLAGNVQTAELMDCLLMWTSAMIYTRYFTLAGE